MTMSKDLYEYIANDIAHKNGFCLQTSDGIVECFDECKESALEAINWAKNETMNNVCKLLSDSLPNHINTKYGRMSKSDFLKRIRKQV